MVILLLFILVFISVLLTNHKSVPAFLYHQVNEISPVTPELFEEHLKILKKNNYKAITLTEFKEKKYSKKDKLVLITLDDGYYDNFKIVYPLLKKYSMKATIFINTLFIKEKRLNKEVVIKNNNIANYEAVKNYIDNEIIGTEQYMTWEEIKIMHESKIIDFQAHSHKHRACFENLDLKGFHDGKSKDPSDYFLYGEIKSGYPIFRKRGEMSIKEVEIKKEFFEKFKLFYDQNLKNKNRKKGLELGQHYINNELKNYIKYENQVEAEQRIIKDALKNKELIEKKLNKKIFAFCWPWGHKSKMSKEILKKINFDTFVTTKKGGNSKRNPDLEKIRRIELRKFTPFKFKLNLYIAQNKFLAKLYEMIS